MELGSGMDVAATDELTELAVADCWISVATLVDNNTVEVDNDTRGLPLGIGEGELNMTCKDDAKLSTVVGRV